MRRADNFPMDNVDQVRLPDELLLEIADFAERTARFGGLRHHVDVTHEEEIRTAVERVWRLLLSGEDADSIRGLTMSPWGPNGT